MKRVLDVGNCAPDHAAIKNFLTSQFECQVEQAHLPEDALGAVRTGRFDLVLVNRKLDADYSDGIEIIRLIHSEDGLSEVATMLVTNYAEHQDQAVALGAARGFGKLEFADPETIERLAAVLDPAKPNRS